MNKIKIGIDPDIDKSGFAVYNTEENRLDLDNYSFWGMIKQIEWLQQFDNELHIVIEAGWLINKSNWHYSKNQSKVVGEAIAKKVGVNHAVGILLENYCKHKDISYELMKPKGKVDSKRFEKIWGIKKSNQEVRDAAMLLINFKKYL